MPPVKEKYLSDKYSDKFIEEKLKFIDKRAGLFLLLSLIFVAVLFSKDTAAYFVIFLGPIYLIGYLLVFRKISGQFKSKENMFLARSGKSYVFRYICEILLLLFSAFFVIAIIKNIIGRW